MLSLQILELMASLKHLSCIYQSLMLEMFLSYDANYGKDLADFLEQEDRVVIESDH